MVLAIAEGVTGDGGIDGLLAAVVLGDGSLDRALDVAVEGLQVFGGRALTGGLDGLTDRGGFDVLGAHVVRGELGVAEVNKRDEAVFQRVNEVEHIARLIVGEVTSELEFNAGEVKPVNLQAKALEVGGGRLGSSHVRDTKTLDPPHPL